MKVHCHTFELGNVTCKRFDLRAGELVCLAIPQDWEFAEVEECLLNSIEPGKSNAKVSCVQKIDFSTWEKPPELKTFFNELMAELGRHPNLAPANFDFSVKRFVEIGMSLRDTQVFIYNTLGSDTQGAAKIDEYVIRKVVQAGNCAIKLMHPLVGRHSIEFRTPKGARLHKVCTDDRYKLAVPDGERIEDLLDLN